MKLAPPSQSGLLLWQMLPLIYRRWDGTHGKDPTHPVVLPEQRGDFAELLDSYGILLDRIRLTLEQRLLDTSPETCQEWLIPYFADLLDVHLVSPDVDGQRVEVARAVLWRQRKGTIGNTREVGREVGRFERIALSPVFTGRATFDGVATEKHYRLDLDPNLQPGSVVIVADGSAPVRQTVTDDGAGALTGDVDPTGANSVNYRTGAIDVKLKKAPLAGLDNLAVDFEAVRHRQFPTIVLHEGFRRVATTARIDAPLPSLRSGEFLHGQHDAYRTADPPSPIVAALRPGLAAGTVDFRYLSRAREIARDTVESRVTAFGENAVRWQQEYPRGVPCYRDTYQDHSVRTPDLRTPDWSRGHYHPHRVIAYTAPRDGFFTPGQLELQWQWWELLDQNPPAVAQREDEDGNRIEEGLLSIGDLKYIDRRITSRSGHVTEHRIVGRETNEAALSIRTERVANDEYRFDAGMERVALAHDGLEVVALRGFADDQERTLTDEIGIRDVRLPLIALPPGATLEGTGGDAVMILERLVTTGTLSVNAALLRAATAAVQTFDVDVAELSPAAVQRLADFDRNADRYALGSSLLESIGPTAAPVPAVEIVDALIESLGNGGNGGCRLEYCTVLGSTACRSLEASDSILLEADPASFVRLYLRYCCVPWLPEGPVAQGRAFEETVIRKPPLLTNSPFGSPGCGVLHPASHERSRLGAEDGGELGAYHHRRHVLREIAALDKMREFLPVTQTPVLVPQRGWVRPLPPLT